MSSWGMSARPSYICITYLDPRPKASNSGIRIDPHVTSKEVDNDQRDLYREACKYNSRVLAPWLYADGVNVTKHNCREVMGLSWSSVQDKLRSYGATEICGKQIEIRIDQLVQADKERIAKRDGEREAEKQRKELEASVTVKRKGPPPATEEQRRASYERLIARDRERKALYEGTQTPEQRRVKKCERMKLYRLRKKLLTGSSS